MLLHKGFSKQGTTWSSRRECNIRRDCYDHLEWSPNIMGFINSMNMCQKEVDHFQQTLGRMYKKRSSTHNKKREEKMGETEDQSLIVHTRRYHRMKEDHHHNKREDHHHKRQNKFRRDLSNIWCYTCDEKGHYSRYCPRNRGSSNKKSNKKRHDAHTV